MSEPKLTATTDHPRQYSDFMREANAALRAENAALKDNAVDLRRRLFDTAAAYHAEVAPAGYPVSFFHCHHEVCMKARALLSPQPAEPCPHLNQRQLGPGYPHTHYCPDCNSYVCGAEPVDPIVEDPLTGEPVRKSILDAVDCEPEGDDRDAR